MNLTYSCLWGGMAPPRSCLENLSPAPSGPPVASYAAMLAMSELEYTGIMERLDRLK